MNDRSALRLLETGALYIGALVLFVHLILAVGLALATGILVIGALVIQGLFGRR